VELQRKINLYNFFFGIIILYSYNYCLYCIRLLFRNENIVSITMDNGWLDEEKRCTFTISQCLQGEVEPSYCSIAQWIFNVIHNIAEGLLVLDSEGNIKLSNKAAEELFGYYRMELFRKPFVELLAPPYRQKWIRTFLAKKKKKPIYQYELLGQKKDKTTFFMEISVSEVFLKEGKVLSVLVRDIRERKALEKAALEASEHERQRIGQDIHDSLCQLLIGIEFKAQFLSQELREKAAVGHELASEIAKLAREAATSARDIAKGLAPLAMSTSDLIASLMDLAQNTGKNTPITCQFHLIGEPVIPNPSFAIQLYRIAQEAVNNVIKHSGASHIDITFGETSGTIFLQVEDNGIGMKIKDGINKGLGFRSMLYRAGMIGANLSIDSLPGKGTKIICSLPSAQNTKTNG